MGKNLSAESVAFKTIKRRQASLSSIFSFYQGLGTIKSNPFKVAEIPDGFIGHNSRALEKT